MRAGDDHSKCHSAKPYNSWRIIFDVAEWTITVWLTSLRQGSGQNPHCDKNSIQSETTIGASAIKLPGASGIAPPIISDSGNMGTQLLAAVENQQIHGRSENIFKYYTKQNGTNKLET